MTAEPVPEPVPGTVRPGGRTARVRTAVLRAAGDVLAERGFAHLDLADVARQGQLPAAGLEVVDEHVATRGADGDPPAVGRDGQPVDVDAELGDHGAGAAVEHLDVPRPEQVPERLDVPGHDPPSVG